MLHTAGEKAPILRESCSCLLSKAAGGPNPDRLIPSLGPRTSLSGGPFFSPPSPLGKQTFAWYDMRHGNLIHSNGKRASRGSGASCGAHAPRTLDEVVGQIDAVGPGSWLRSAIEGDSLSSVILFGPAGTGKTSLAHVIAEHTKATFVEVSAIGGTVSRPAPRDQRRGKAPDDAGPSNHPVRRRDPPFQPQPARRAAPCGGEPRARAGGSHHGEPVLRSELSTHQPFPRG